MRLRSRLTACPFIVGLLAVCSTEARAADVTFTITGTVSSGNDQTGVFGFPPNTDLSNKAFTLVLTFDDMKGTPYAFNTDQGLPYASIIVTNQTNGSSPGTAVLMIGAGSFSFGTSPLAVSSSNALRQIYLNGGTNGGTPLGPTGIAEWVSDNYSGWTYADAYVSTQIAQANGQTPPMTTNSDWRSPFSYTLTDADLALGWATSFDIDLTNLFKEV